MFDCTSEFVTCHIHVTNSHVCDKYLLWSWISCLSVRPMFDCTSEFVTCMWRVGDMCVTCSWHVYDMSLVSLCATYVWLCIWVRDLYVTCMWHVCDKHLLTWWGAQNEDVMWRETQRTQTCHTNESWLVSLWATWHMALLLVMCARVTWLFGATLPQKRIQMVTMTHVYVCHDVWR